VPDAPGVNAAGVVDVVGLVDIVGSADATGEGALLPMQPVTATVANADANARFNKYRFIIITFPNTRHFMKCLGFFWMVI
jgi:hypothetical protein